MNYTIEKIDYKDCHSDMLLTTKSISFDKLYWPTLDEVYAVFMKELRLWHTAYDIKISFVNDRLSLVGSNIDAHFMSRDRGVQDSLLQTFLDQTAKQYPGIDYKDLRIVYSESDHRFSLRRLTDVEIFVDDELLDDENLYKV